eukprot:TRINITY_DN15135_c0_g2_i2.p1 TRINITY_DN15135_c0_g2~~TRINITY_DN15135_c0_g2_i2.p1  ORF type:complete len:213 (+),score=30.13 TRINITY_DN15135_c0_g2_i2:125-763(+)
MTQAPAARKDDYIFKLIMIGDSRVGKTQLISRYIKNDFNMNSTPTFGVEFTHKTIEMEGKQVSIRLWDTIGQEKFRSLTSIYYKGAVGAILVYDITNRKSFESACTQWLGELGNFSESNIVLMLVGNKCDLKDKRKVTIEDATSFAEKHSKLEGEHRNGVHGDERQGLDQRGDSLRAHNRRDLQNRCEGHHQGAKDCGGKNEEREEAECGGQ